jgi:hypothetical protein
MKKNSTSHQGNSNKKHKRGQAGGTCNLSYSRFRDGCRRIENSRLYLEVSNILSQKQKAEGVAQVVVYLCVQGLEFSPSLVPYHTTNTKLHKDVQPHTQQLLKEQKFIRVVKNVKKFENSCTLLVGIKNGIALVKSYLVMSHLQMNKQNVRHTHSSLKRIDTYCN